MGKAFSTLIFAPQQYAIPGIEKILLKYGYEDQQPKGGSSHHTFRKKGCSPITIPAHSPIKKVYVEMVRDLVESEEQAK
nr:toxin HicA [Acidaminococcus timonensis]